MQPRFGKTAKERASGVHANRFNNRVRRAAWQHSQHSPGPTDPFPVTACNGKRNRHRVTGKGGETVYLK